MPSFLEQRSTDNFRYPTSSKNQIWGLYIKDKNKKYHVAPLSQSTLKLRVHYAKGQAPSVCQMIFFDKDDPNAVCPECEKPNLKYPGKKTMPSHILLFLGYVFELKGKKGRSKAGRDFDESPIKVISVPSGSKQINWGAIEGSINEDGDFMDSVWKLEDADDGDKQGFQVPAKAGLKKLGTQFDLHEPDEERAKYSEKSDAEIQSILMATFAGIPWDNEDMVEAGYANPYPPEEAESTSTEEEEETTPEVDTSVLD